MILTATVHPTPPRAEIHATDLPANTAWVAAHDSLTHRTLYRADVAGAEALLIDHTIPAGESVTLVRAYAANGDVLGEASVTITTPEPPSSHVWLSDPLDEGSALLVPATVQGDQERPRYAPVAASRTLDGRTILSIGQRHRGQWVLAVKAETPEMIRALAHFIDHAASVLVRAGTEMYLPGRLYGALPESSEVLRLTAARDTATWLLVVEPSDGPGIGAVISTWTWDALEQFCEAAGITWDSLGDTFPTWLDVERGPVEA